MFEYVVSDLIARDASNAIEIARRKAVAGKLLVMSIKRVNEKRAGRTTLFTVVLVVSQDD